MEAGVHVQRTMFGDVLDLDDAFGAGGQLAWFFLPNLAVEGDISFVPTSGPRFGDITFRPIYGRLIYNIPLAERVKLMAGLGYVLATYAGDTTDNEYEEGFHALGGLKFYLTPSWHMRLEGLYDRMPSPGNQIDAATNKEGYTNLTFRLGLGWTYPPLERCVVTIEPTSASMNVGESRSFRATARGDRTGRTRNARITYSSDDNAITSDGTYTGRTPGTHTITATASGSGCSGARATTTASATVTQPPPPVAPTPTPPRPTLQSLDLRPDSATVLRGETVQFSVSGRMSDGSTVTPSVTYSGPGVNANGLFSAGVDTGVVQIRACSTDSPSICDTSPVRVMRLRSTVVNFDLSSAVVDAEAQARLQAIIAAIKANPRATVRVDAHADTIPPRGVRGVQASKQFNFRLSLARGDSVTSFLINNGVDRSRFEPRIRGYSFCTPAVPHRAPADYEKDAQGRPLGERANRRVEVFELALEPTEELRWVCGGRPEPQTKPIPQR